MNPMIFQAITNPAIPKFGVVTTKEAIGGNLTSLIVTLWRVVLILGGLALIVFVIMGGVAWITAGGDKAKVEEARDRIANAFIGLLILFATVAFVNFIGPAIGFDVLNLNLPDNYQAPTP